MQDIIYLFFKHCVDSKYLNHEGIFGMGKKNLVASDK